MAGGYPPGRIGGGPPRPPLDDVTPPGPAPAPAPEPAPTPPPTPEPAPDAELIDVPALGTRYAGDTIYAEILNRDPNPFTSAERPTNGHESCHGVNNRIRNQAGGRANGFYVLGGKGVVVQEPNFRLSAIRDFIPDGLRGSRYQLYLVTQAKDWDDRPLYICDEWTAYIAGCAVAVQDFRAGKVSSADWIAGPVEFSIYAVALAAACAKLDAASWAAGGVRRFINYQLANAGRHYLSGKDIREMNFGQQFALLTALRQDPAAAALRDSVTREFPANADWLLRSPIPANLPRALGRVVTCQCR